MLRLLAHMSNHTTFAGSRRAAFAMLHCFGDDLRDQHLLLAESPRALGSSGRISCINNADWLSFRGKNRNALKATFFHHLPHIKPHNIARRDAVYPGRAAESETPTVLANNVVFVTFRAGVDEPVRFSRSRSVPAHFGLTPSRYQSGEIDQDKGISKCGDAGIRWASVEAAGILLRISKRSSPLKAWGLSVARRQPLCLTNPAPKREARHCPEGRDGPCPVENLLGVARRTSMGC
ncbi:hypothetical protein B5V01_21075 [Mesorhizobium erdmanii]|uniref:Transposase IS116/IS110/IS902 C-terminal domain-containing protein n=2 Tax=Mesorhizobium TaxID=68287 RepID=A0A3M9X069_9HYPH|nr:hypothetical protein DNR46_34125 [Mesorhizobium japonicum]RXT43069.1 hypothetical protein B5V01_21075 [Mesorhizobium erdmanii]